MRIKAKARKPKRPYFEPDKVHDIVGAAIQRMAAEERQVWSKTTNKPGLHVRKSPDHEGNPQYDIVRAISIDSGSGPCIKVFFQHGSEEFPQYQISQSQFQRIEE